MNRRANSLIVANLIGLSQIVPNFTAAQQAAQTTPAPAAAKIRTATAPQASAAQVDKPWPRSYTAPSGAGIVIYQPQIASWENQKRLVAYAAVSYLAGEAQKPALGIVRIEGDTETSLTERLVKFSKSPRRVFKRSPKSRPER
jgi:hypothetical protein